MKGDGMMIKKTVSFLMVLLMLAGMMCSAGAVHTDRYGTATYDGKKINTSFSTGVVNMIDGNFQPGDDFTITITLANSCDVATDWYMSNAVLDVFEDLARNDNGTYSYALRYNGTPIFDSSVIGGESSQTLKDSTGQLKDFFYLGTIPSKGGGVVELDFGIDGETQNNDYWNTLSKLQMQFAVEKPNKSVIIVPKTADRGELYIWGGITLVCAVSALLITFGGRKKKAEGSAE